MSDGDNRDLDPRFSQCSRFAWSPSLLPSSLTAALRCPTHATAQPTPSNPASALHPRSTIPILITQRLNHSPPTPSSRLW